MRLCKILGSRDDYGTHVAILRYVPWVQVPLVTVPQNTCSFDLPKIRHQNKQTPSQIHITFIIVIIVVSVLRTEYASRISPLSLE